MEAKERALRYLEYRARSRKEITDKLSEYPQEIVNDVLAMLEEYGYVDDPAFAKDYAEARVRNKGYGKHRIKHELYTKGIKSDIIDIALSELGFDEVEAATEKLRRKVKGELTEKERQRYHGYLVRQGFGYDVIRQAFKRFEGDGI
jgi:regulatory protein